MIRTQTCSGRRARAPSLFTLHGPVIMNAIRHPGRKEPSSFPSPSLSLDVPDVHIHGAPRRAASSPLARSFVVIISVGDMVEHGRRIVDLVKGHICSFGCRCSILNAQINSKPPFNRRVKRKDSL